MSHSHSTSHSHPHTHSHSHSHPHTHPHLHPHSQSQSQSAPSTTPSSSSSASSASQLLHSFFLSPLSSPNSTNHSSHNSSHNSTHHYNDSNQVKSNTPKFAASSASASASASASSPSAQLPPVILNNNTNHPTHTSLHFASPASSPASSPSSSSASSSSSSSSSSSAVRPHTFTPSSMSPSPDSSSFAAVSVSGATFPSNSLNSSLPASSSSSSSSSSPSPSMTNVNVDLKTLGNTYFREGKYADALQSFSAALQDEQDNPVLYSNRSAVYHALCDYERALEDANRAITARPSWAKGYYRRGQALQALMQLHEAKIAYEQSAQLDPTEPNLLRALDEIKALIEEVALTKKEVASKQGRSDVDAMETDKYQRLIVWLQRGGAKFPYLYLQYYDVEYRGVHAITRVAANKVVLEVPISHIMTSELAKSSDICTKIIKSKCELASSHSFIAAYLLQERYNPTSFWEPYISSLPHQYKNMPIFFDEHDLKHLRGSFTLRKIVDRQEELKEEYENICRHVPEFRRFSHGDFVWARLVVITRIFGLVLCGNKTDGLVPMADMLNHRRPRETSWTFDDARQAFTITTLKSIARGDAIYDSYGRKCNSRFFVNYGFALEDNREDNQVALFFELSLHDPHYHTKLRLLGMNASSSSVCRRRFQIPCDYNEPSTKECFSFLRFIHAQDKEFMLLSSTDQLNTKKIEPVSIRSELAVLSALHRSALDVLAGFDTSLEEDYALLKKGGLPTNMRNCILMRKGEKEVLHFYIDLYKEVEPLTRLAWKDFKKSVAKYYTQKEQIELVLRDRYITTVIVPLMSNSK